MQATINILLEVELFNLEDALRAEQLAKETNSEVYCWKATGQSNWLQKGLSIADVYCLAVLPRNLPDLMDMPDDISEEDIFEEEDEA